MSFYQPGDCTINALVIANKSKSVDARQLMQQLTVYEDVTLPGINVELALIESVDLLSMLPLVGEETLTIDFETPSLKSFSHTFAISAMTESSTTPNMKTRAYNLTAVAKEVMAHKTTLVNKSYNTTNDNMVKDLIQNFLGSNKNVITEATKGIQQYIVSNKRPYTAIKDILLRSVSDKHNSSSFVFFENATGIHFRTLEDLFSQGSIATYTNNEVVADSIFRVIFRNIIGYSIEEQFNSAKKAGQGAFSSTVQTFDLKSLLFGSGTISPDVQGMVKGMNGLMNSPTFRSVMGKSGLSSFIPNNTMAPQTFIDQMVPQRRAYAAEMDQYRLNVRIFGDSSLTVGTKVNLQIMQNTGDTGVNVPHPYLAGEYLVTKLKHVILPLDAKPRYTQLMECVSGGYAKSVS